MRTWKSEVLVIGTTRWAMNCETTKGEWACGWEVRLAFRMERDTIMKATREVHQEGREGKGGRGELKEVK